MKETSKKEEVVVEAAKKVKEVEKKKEKLVKTVTDETKVLVEQIALPDSIEKKPAVEKKAPTVAVTPPVAVAAPEVIIKKDCDFLKDAVLVSEFFLDKNDKKCYGMASATVNGNKQLFALQCDTTPSGVCPTELSMERCRVSSLSGSKLADIF